MDAACLTDVLHHLPSVVRAIRTAQLALDAPHHAVIPVNPLAVSAERASTYGALQGKDRPQTSRSSARRSSHAVAPLLLTPRRPASIDVYRRSYVTVPVLSDRSYATLPPDSLRRGRSADDVV
ncbi:hypothetical protein GCM10023238_24060 [Streptomyces heliomycini]